LNDKKLDKINQQVEIIVSWPTSKLEKMANAKLKNTIFSIDKSCVKQKEGWYLRQFKDDPQNPLYSEYGY